MKKSCALITLTLTLFAVTPAAAVPPVQLVITEAVASTTDGFLTIVGRNFGNDTPIVELAGVGLTVQTSDGFEIVTELPASFGAGTYTLVVSRGPATVQRDDFELTIGGDSGTGSGTVTQIDTGTGLLGGPITTSGTIDVDFSLFDGTYLRLDGLNNGPFARRDEPNNLTGDQITDGAFGGRQVIANNPDSWGRAVVGSADHPDFGVGVEGVLNSTEGYALYGFAPQGSGNTRAVFAEVFSPDGTAGYFVNGGGGTIISGHTTGEAQVFSVEADGSVFSQGNVHANAYFDLLGNPIGLGDVTAAFAGPGLAGGGDFGDLTLEIDEGYLDGIYARSDASNVGHFARRDEPNDLTGDQHTDGSFIAERSIDEGPAIQGRSFSPGFGIGVLGETNGTDGVALYGRSYSTSGGTLGLHAVVHSPDGTAAAFHNEGDGEILSAGSATYGEVMTLAADGTLNVLHLQAETAHIGSDYEPGPGDQIFLHDVLSQAPSGHVRGVNSTTFSPGSFAVVGSAQPATGGVGGSFDTYGDGGTGVWAGAQAPTGFGRALHAQNWSPDGIAGQFDSIGDGQILSGSSNSWGEVFRVQPDGTVQANAYTDLIGNPIGLGDITAAWAGPGLAGGGDFGDVTLEIDEGHLDGIYARADGSNSPNYARRDEPNNLTGDQVTDGRFDGRQMVANNGNDFENALHGVTFGLNATSVWGSNESPDFGTGVHGRTSAPDGQGVWAETTSNTGNARALYAVANNPDGIAGVFDNNAGGASITAGSAGGGERFRVESDGRVSGWHDGGGTPTLQMSATGSWGRGISGSADHPDFGVGVEGVLNSTEGYALYGFAPQGSGNTRAVFAEVFSPGGTAGYFVNGGGGTILSGHTTGEAQVFSVEANGSIFSQGNVHAAAYFDLLGNPIGADGVGVFEINTGAGLVGGPITDSGTIEVDFPFLDGQYARLDSENFFALDQHVPSLFASSQVFAPVVAATELSAEVGVLDTFTPGYTTLIVKQSATNDGNAISAEAGGENQAAVSAHATSPTGSNIALWGKVDSLDATAGVFENFADGRLISAYTPTYGEVFRVDGDGTVTGAAFVSPSSGTLKTNVASLDSALDTVQALRGVSFDWRHDGRHDVGLIAEEVAEILPEVVQIADGDVQGIDYSRLTAVLVEAVKEQQQQIEELKAMVEALVSKR